MKLSRLLALFGALVSSLLSLVCCIPVAAVGAFGLGSAGLLLAKALG